MQIIDRIIVKLFMKQVGEDEIGNRYFESCSKDYLNRPKRIVLYNGMPEPTKISSNWYSWIHYLNDQAPSEEHNAHVWIKPRHPNLTGTGSNDTKRTWVKKNIYSKWQPK